MKMSSCRRDLEGGFVAQHRPQNVDPAASQRDQSLGVLLPLSSIAVVEGPGVRRATQAGKHRLVEDPLEDLVAAAHPAAIAGAFAGAAGRQRLALRWRQIHDLHDGRSRTLGAQPDTAPEPLVSGAGRLHPQSLAK